MSPTSIIPFSLSINSSSPSSTKSPSYGICYGYANMGANPPWVDPYQVPQYSMIFSWVTLIHVKITTIWCLFPCNAHLHVQHIEKMDTLLGTWWHWQDVGFSPPRHHHSQGLVGQHGYTWYQSYFFHASFHNGIHGLVLYEPFFFISIVCI